MKKKQIKLSLEKIDIARLTVNMHHIFGGDLPKHTDLCPTVDTSVCTTCTSDPQSNSSVECVIRVSDDCPSQQLGCNGL
ncbi:MAG: hypothetical protein ABJD69_15820 [Dokdonia sp.]|uniref:hypothetical protein n=2 Tax=Dokdonia sp. TaxID=2024995 RepID=UPI003263DC0B